MLLAVYANQASIISHTCTIEVTAHFFPSNQVAHARTHCQSTMLILNITLKTQIQTILIVTINIRTCNQGVQRRMVLVVNNLVFLKSYFLLCYLVHVVDAIHILC